MPAPCCDNMGPAMTLSVKDQAGLVVNQLTSEEQREEVYDGCAVIRYVLTRIDVNEDMRGVREAMDFAVATCWEVIGQTHSGDRPDSPDTTIALPLPPLAHWFLGTADLQGLLHGCIQAKSFLRHYQAVLTGPLWVWILESLQAVDEEISSRLQP